MQIAVYQFSISNNISDNFLKIKKAIIDASNNKVRLLVFQECALCGYPPIEIDSIKNIDFIAQNNYLNEISQLSKIYNMYIAVGCIKNEKNKYYNSIQIISPNGSLLGTYDKKALWGWDIDNFEKGESSGIYQIDDLKIGFRICFEVRFPEYFREMFYNEVDLCFVSFCDISENENNERYNTIKSHLVTRAVENVMTVISVNSVTKFQTAPSAVINQDGCVLLEAQKNSEHLLIYNYNSPQTTFGMEGRIKISKQLIK